MSCTFCLSHIGCQLIIFCSANVIAIFQIMGLSAGYVDLSRHIIEFLLKLHSVDDFFRQSVKYD